MSGFFGASVQPLDADLTVLASATTGAWTTWTPTIGSTAGTITSYTVVEAVYAKIGRLVAFHVAVTITTAGTGTGLTITLPTNAASRNSVAGRNNAIGVMLQGFLDGGGTNLMSVQRYDGTNVIVDGALIYVSGVYHSAT